MCQDSRLYEACSVLVLLMTMHAHLDHQKDAEYKTEGVQGRKHFAVKIIYPAWVPKTTPAWTQIAFEISVTSGTAKLQVTEVFLTPKQ